MDVLASHLRELITDQRHFLARAEKILDFLEKNNIPTDTSFTAKTDPESFNAEEHHELERSVRQAALYHLNTVNKKSSPLENPESKAKNSSKPSSRVTSTKKEKNLDTDDSNSSQVSSPALSGAAFSISNLNINITVVAPQKKDAKKRGKAKDQRKQDTDESTTSNSNSHAEEVSGESNMDIIPASRPQFNQSLQFENSSDNSGPNSFPRWFWYICSLILLINFNRSNVPYLQINYTDTSTNFTNNSRKNCIQTTQRASIMGDKNKVTSGTDMLDKHRNSIRSDTFKDLSRTDIKLKSD